jgi:hypothetical protein
MLMVSEQAIGRKKIAEVRVIAAAQTGVNSGAGR